MGHVVGNISASDKINVRENGRVEGDLHAPTVAIAEGARFRGRIDMERQATPRGAHSRTVASAEEKSTSTSDAERASKPAVAPLQASAARAAH